MAGPLKSSSQYSCRRQAAHDPANECNRDLSPTMASFMWQAVSHQPIDGEGWRRSPLWSAPSPLRLVTWLFHVNGHAHPRMDTTLKVMFALRQARDFDLTALQDSRPGYGHA